MDPRQQLKFSDFDSSSNMEKVIPGDVNIVEEELQKQADLYHHELFVPIPFNHNQSLGVFPQDQQLSNKYVLCWNSLRTIPTSILDNSKIVKIKISSELLKSHFAPLGSGVYASSIILNTLPMEEVTNITFD